MVLFLHAKCSEKIITYILNIHCKYVIIVVRGSTMFIKILTKTYDNKKHYYASLVENKRINGKVVQAVNANLGPVTEEQMLE